MFNQDELEKIKQNDLEKNSIMIIIATESQKEKACIKRIIKGKSYLYLKIILNKVTQE